MSLFKKVDQSMKSEDRVPGGSGFKILPANIYDAKVKVAWYSESAAENSKSAFLNVEFVLDVDGTEMSHTQRYLMKGRNGLSTYKDKKTGEDMPHFSLLAADDLCILVADKDLYEVGENTEETLLDLWNFEERKKVPTKSTIFPDLMEGNKVRVALNHELDFKQMRTEKGDYVPDLSADPRESNDIVMVLCSDDHGSQYVNHTLNEVKASKVAENLDKDYSPVWAEKWLELNQGKVYDKRKPEDSAKAKKLQERKDKLSGGGKSEDTAQPARKGLFGK